MELESYEPYEIDEDIALTDLLSIEELTKIQETFSKMARVAALITDAEGRPITQGSNFNRFCTDYCRATKEGKRRCEQCDRMGMQQSFEQKKPVSYFCHAKLVDFAAPILLNGKVIGGMVGGQVLSEEPDLEAISQIAGEIGVDEEEFVDAAREIPIIPAQAIERCTNFLYEFADMLSDMAYRTYIAKKEGEVALKAATAKTDFLANMSHEIRTPMNAIIGMSQIALREEMSKKARSNIDQVLTSANMLLAIINDILDYSKLDAGKMKISPVEYEPLTLVKDIVSIISNRIGAKDLELIVDMDPDIPQVLLGDDIRMKQIIVNLANNAIKFTETGQVSISLKKKWISDSKINLCVSVQDTGIGIKPEDMSKLFNSFEQVDSKRNRKIEGTGLGLAIVNSLVGEMGGTIRVESEYGSGSTFSFEVPQEVIRDNRSVERMSDCPVIAGYVENVYVRKQLEKDMAALGAQYMSVGEDMLYAIIEQGDIDFVFIEEGLVTQELIEIVHDRLQTHDLKLVVITAIDSCKFSQEERLVLLRKPATIYTISSVLQNISLETDRLDEKTEEIDFELPDVKALVVDDNEVNLTVAEGLMDPFHMQLDFANSGMKALEMIAAKPYDIIFMDHMMPEMDGIETTHLIRAHDAHYEKTPIIALTANAVAGSKEQYLQEGLNDFVAKPIVLSAITDVLRKWIPADKIKNVTLGSVKTAKTNDVSSGLASITFLDTKYALGLLKSEKLFWKVLKDYYSMIDRKIEKIKSCEQQEEIGTYVVEVHALKSSSKQIGALSLSKKAEFLEKIGNQHDIKKIHEMTDEMLGEYRNLRNALAPYFVEEETENDTAEAGQVIAESVSADQVRSLIQTMKEAIDDLNMDMIEEVLSNNQFRPEDSSYVEKLRQLSWDMDIDGCMSLLDEWDATC